MRIVTVIPISKGIGKDTLTYFTQKDVTAGSIVSVPLRKKVVFGLVVDSKIAHEMKSELKMLSYNLKKIDRIETRMFLSAAFVEAAKKIADYNASSIGSVISALIPKIILEESRNSPLMPENPRFNEADKPYYETALLQSDDDERYSTYRGLIREEFAKNRSVFFCLPGAEDLLNAKITLEKGIEKYTYLFHSGLSKKEIVATWKNAVLDPHPILIVATGQFLSLPRNDLGTIILEKESSRAYKMLIRPFVDFRSALEIIAKQLNIRLVLGDIFLRTETLWEEKRGGYTALSPLKFRSLTTSDCELLDMRAPEDMKKKEFKIFSEKLKNLIVEAKENNEHTFLFCGRKGLFPQTVCSDCGTIVVCKNCGTPVILYSNPGAGAKPTATRRKTNGKPNNLFVCHHCGERRDAEELCIHCGGWRLNPIGIGVDRVVEEVKSVVPDANIIIVDKDHISTHGQAVKARDLFYKTPGSIMVGTEMALTYLNEKIENAAVVTIDAYFSIPDFQINEKIFHILLNLRALSLKHTIFQTRQENTKIFDYALRGNLIDFYRDEIEERKSIGYPPFTTYIKITLEGEKNAVKKIMSETVEFMKPYELSVFDAFNPGSKSKYAVHGLISLQKGKWVDGNLLDKLRRLSPKFVIKIDPITLL